MNANEYTFEGLGGGGEYVTSLAYLVALITSTSEAFRNEENDWVLAAHYDFEEQARSPSDLLEGERLHLPDNVFPQTPVMITRRWSPLASVLEKGLQPIFLRRAKFPNNLGVGIWLPHAFGDAKDPGSCRTDEELFWSVFDLACSKAKERNLAVAILAEPGWSYESAIGSLQNWTAKQTAKADRVFWRRTPEG